MANRRGGGGRTLWPGEPEGSLKRDYFAYVFVFLGNIMDNSLVIFRVVILTTTLCALLPFFPFADP